MKRTTRTEYFYNEDEKICRSVTTETFDCNEDCPCAEGELLTSEIEFTEDGPTFADTALALAGLGLCLTAVAAIFKRR
nr:hypothetical protein [uncultured Oscillibacter sp.]